MNSAMRLLDVLLAVSGIVLASGGVATGTSPLLYGGAGVFLIGSSTFVVHGGLTVFTGESIRDEAGIDEDTGWLIGKLENILVLTLVIIGEWTALSIVFAAKSFVRREDISSGNTTYYLAGTLLNFTYAVLVGLAAAWLSGGL